MYRTQIRYCLDFITNFSVSFAGIYFSQKKFPYFPHSLSISKICASGTCITPSRDLHHTIKPWIILKKLFQPEKENWIGHKYFLLFIAYSIRAAVHNKLKYRTQSVCVNAFAFIWSQSLTLVPTSESCCSLIICWPCKREPSSSEYHTVAERSPSRTGRRSLRAAPCSPWSSCTS